jgi:hypothetical protein
VWLKWPEREEKRSPRSSGKALNERSFASSPPRLSGAVLQHRGNTAFNVCLYMSVFLTLRVLQKGKVVPLLN